MIKNESGNVAISFILSTLPLVIGMGGAIDYTRYTDKYAELQAHADADALSKRNGVYINETDYRVQVSEELEMFFLPIIGIETFTVKVEAVAKHKEATLKYKVPVVAELDPEASDYNRLYVYCFNQVSKKRGDEVAISDNAGTKYNYTMPTCKAGERLEHKLLNVRDARTNKKQWDKGGERYTYYTDNLSVNILETVLCKNLAECKTGRGGVLPEGKNRSPYKEFRVCEPGKFMYYGYEDRPVGGDKDYDDIRVIIECPTIEQNGDKIVRLIK